MTVDKLMTSQLNPLLLAQAHKEVYHDMRTLRQRRLDETNRKRNNAKARAKRAGVVSFEFLEKYPTIPSKRVAAFERLLLEHYYSRDGEPFTSHRDWFVRRRTEGESDSLPYSRSFPYERVFHALSVGDMPEDERTPLILELLSRMISVLCPKDLLSNTPKSLRALKQLIALQDSLGGHFRGELTVRAARFLARRPPLTRFAYLKSIPGAGEHTIQLRDLNMERGQKASCNPAFRFSTLPMKVQWETILPGYPYFPVRGMSLTGFKASTFKRIMMEFPSIQPSKILHVYKGLHTAVYSLVHLFGDYEAVKRYVLAHSGKWGLTGIHNAGQFLLPEKGKSWTPSKWAPLVQRSPGAANFLSRCPELEAKGLFPSTLREFRTLALQARYPEVSPGFESLRDLCIKYGLEPEVYVRNVEFWRKVRVKPADFMPDVFIKGDEAGLPSNWRIEKLEAQSILGPILGSLTGCCQHILGAGQDSAVAGVCSPYSAFYVVFKDNKVIAQSWAWRATDGSVVFDSIESSYREDDMVTAVSQLYQVAAAQMLQSPLGVRGVLIGNCSSGVTESVLEKVKLVNKHEYVRKPFDPFGYFDGVCQRLIAGAVSATNHPGLRRELAYDQLKKKWVPGR